MRRGGRAAGLVACALAAASGSLLAVGPAAGATSSPLHTLAPGTSLGGGSVRHVALPLSGPAPIRGEGPDPLRASSSPPTTLEGPVAGDVSASANWAGHAVLGGGARFSGVAGHWTVPAVAAAVSSEYAATWIGIGGVGSTALLQTGTTEETSGGATSYFAWVELLPAAPVVIDATVRPGDAMEALLTETAPGTWTISIRDDTQGWLSQRTTVAYTAGPATSAEWITERPQVAGMLSTLADFGATRFRDLAVRGTSTSSATPLAIDMTGPTSRIIAYPSDLSAATTGSFVDHYGTPVPTVTSVTPPEGSTAGGTAVTITGTYLVPGLVVSVHFGAVVATGSIAPDGTITVSAPAEPPGTVDVTVTTTDGTTAPTGADHFTYLPPGPPVTTGYDLVGADGGVFVFDGPGQSGGYYGSLPALHVTPAEPVVGMVPTATDGGYFLVGADGGVFAFGTAPYLGSLPGLHVTPAQPVTGIVVANTDRGYFLVGRDGGVFAFGTVPFLGSLPGEHVSVDDIVGIAATASGDGYWLVSATGTVYAFGSAQHLGTATGAGSAVAAITGLPTGSGYWATTSTGAVVARGAAVDYGTLPSLGVVPALPVIGIVRPAGASGYWLLGADGGIFAFGSAPYDGSLPGLGVHVADIVGAVAN